MRPDVKKVKAELQVLHKLCSPHSLHSYFHHWLVTSVFTFENTVVLWYNFLVCPMYWLITLGSKNPYPKQVEDSDPDRSCHNGYMLGVCGEHNWAFVVWPCFDELDIPLIIYRTVRLMSRVFKFSSVPDILANSHGSNDLFHCLFSLLLLLIVQLRLQFKDLPWKMKCWQQHSLNILSDSVK